MRHAAQLCPRGERWGMSLTLAALIAAASPLLLAVACRRAASSGARGDQDQVAPG